MLLGAVKSVTGIVASCSSLTDSKGLSSSAFTSSYNHETISSVALVTLIAITTPAASATCSRRKMRLVRRRLQTRFATEQRLQPMVTLPALWQLVHGLSDNIEACNLLRSASGRAMDKVHKLPWRPISAVHSPKLHLRSESILHTARRMHNAL